MAGSTVTMIASKREGSRSLVYYNRNRDRLVTTMATEPPPPEWDMLLSAAQKNRPELIAEMIEIGRVNPSHANAVGQSAVHIAALWGHHESVQALCEKGANVNAQNDMTGATPLHMLAQSQKATLERRIKCAEILLQYGARVDQPDHYSTLPVQTLYQMLGAEGGEDALTKKLIGLLQPSRPAIHEALKERNVANLRELLGHDSSLSNLPFQGDTPVEIVVDDLIKAATTGDDAANEDNGAALVSILEVLLEHGGGANGGESTNKTNVALSTGEFKEPPLHKVAGAVRECYNNQQSGSEDQSASLARLATAVDLLIKGGATLTDDTAQLLHQAARRGEVSFARFLMERLHVDANVKGRQGMTPLQFAARSGKMEMLVRVR